MVNSVMSGDKTVESWLEHLAAILKDYDAKNIRNCDETGCFWKALPDKGLAEQKKSCKGGKKSKLRVTNTFFVNALGKSRVFPLSFGNLRTQDALKVLTSHNCLFVTILRRSHG